MKVRDQITHRMQASRLSYDRIPVGLALSSPLPTPPILVVLFHLLAPVDDRKHRAEMVRQVSEWLPVLRRWFEQPGHLLPQFSAFLQESLGWPAFRYIQLDTLDALCAEGHILSISQIESYDLFVGDMFMKREWASEQFSLNLALELMK